MPLLLNELAAEPRSAILVLDDYQAVTNPDCHELLALFIERLPATLHLVVATRIHPPIPLARLRARGQLAELGAADLRFTLEEATALLNDRLGLAPLDRSDVAMLHTSPRTPRRATPEPSTASSGSIPARMQSQPAANSA